MQLLEAVPPKPGITVVYIGGAPRSGSTVLCLWLGSLPGVFAAGEMRYVWRQLALGGRCGCGLPLAACDVWRGALIQQPSMLSSEIRALARAARRHSRLGVMLRCTVTARAGRLPWSLRRHLERTAPIYQALRDTQGAAIVVDSSKSPSYALLLSQDPRIRLHMVHLVRDPRAVVYSVMRGRGSRGARRIATIPLQALKWSAWNAVTEVATRRRASSYVRMHYERFVAQPTPTARAILRRCEDVVPAGWEGVSPRLPAVNHTAFGNGVRVDNRPESIRSDSAWRTEMPWYEQLLVLAFTWPLQVRYLRDAELAA